MPYVRKLPSQKWQATVRTPDGSRRTRTDPLKRVVETWARDQEADMRRGSWADPQDGNVTVEQWWTEWSAARSVEANTLARDRSHWRNHVQPRWGAMKLRAITPLDVEQWISDMRRREVGAVAAQQSVRLLRHMLADATRHKRIRVDPTAGVPLPRAPKHVDRFLTVDEFDALFAHVSQPQDQALILLMTYCGLRWGEASGLHAHRVDFGRGQLMVVEVTLRDGSVKPLPKSAAGQRVVPMVDRVADALRPFVSSGMLFPGVAYTNWRRRVFVPAVKAAGLALPYPTPHDLRHTYGSWLAENGVPPHEIAALMGHSSLRATERYLHAGDGRLARARAALGQRATVPV